MNERIHSSDSGRVDLHRFRPCVPSARSLACGLFLAVYAAPVVLPVTRDLAHGLDHRRQSLPSKAHADPHDRAHEIALTDREPSARHVLGGETHVHGPEGAHVHGGFAGALLVLTREPLSEAGPQRIPGRTSVDLHLGSAIDLPLGSRIGRSRGRSAGPPDPSAAPDLLPPTPPPRA